MDSNTISCLGYPVYSGKLDDIPFDGKVLINTINQYSYCIAEEDVQFKTVLNDSDILLPDGVGIVAACKFLYNRNIKKIAGADLHFYLLEKLNKNNGSCFYLGSSENTLNKIKARLNTEFPNIRAGFYSPPYKTTFSDLENAEMIKAVNSFGPNVLFVGMTAPKQEKWTYSHKSKLNSNLICSIGAVFDFYAGTVKRPGKIWLNMGLEWAGRLLNEPKRMWKRYLYYGPHFGYVLIKEKLKTMI